jgi:hypothetical protein
MIEFVKYLQVEQPWIEYRVAEPFDVLYALTKSQSIPI